jgi:hypothetical protein
MKSKIEYTRADESSFDGTAANRYSADEVALFSQHDAQPHVVRELKCQHDWHTFFNKGYRKCNKCGEEYCIKAF